MMRVKAEDLLLQALSGFGTGAVGVAAVNSIDFVRHTFSFFSSGVAAATFRTEADRVRLGDLGVDRFVAPNDDRGWARLEFSPSDGESLAQILFTSGTTGAPKAIALTQSNIAGTTRRLNAIMEVDSGIREYIGVPVTYSFGLARARAVSAAGGEFYLPQNGFAPFEIAEMLKRGEINAISAVPTLWRILLQNADLFGPERKALKWIEIGSQLMTRAEKEALKTLYPNAIIVQHYGLTEASRSTFLCIHETDGEMLQSVGKAFAPTEVKTDLAGRIMIRGPHVARFEISGEGPLALTDADGWLTTNDVGFIRDGNLFFEGRLDDLINCGGVKINPDNLEQELASALGASLDEIAVARLPDVMRGEGFLIAIRESSNLDDNAVRSATVSAAAALGVNAAGAIKTCRVKDFARTETGKLKRSAIADQFKAKAPSSGASGSAPDAVSGLDAELVALWRDALGGRTISPKDSFFDLGGDLHAAEALIPQMEALGVPSIVARGMLDGLSIHDIAQQTLAASGVNAGADLELKILSIWREALGRDEVSIDESFYDIGGDSLSAVTVALNLERAGLEPSLAHGVFDGKTIRDLAREHSGISAGQDAADLRPVRKAEIAIFSEASNFMKGVVLLCMIGSHWIPSYLERFGLNEGLLADCLALFFSLGTPTLAFMFGMGIAVFHARQYRKSRPSFDRNIRIATALLSFGVIVNGILEIAGAAASDRTLANGGWIEIFYGPFVYFLIATASLPLWIGRIGKGADSVVALIVAAIVSYAAYAQLVVTLPATVSGGEAFFYKLAVGRWSLLQMGAISLFGAAIGLLIQARLDSGRRPRVFGVLGAAMIVGAILASLAFQSEDIWFDFPKQISLFTLFFYAGVSLVVIASFGRLAGSARAIPPLKLAIDITCCIGILLFPLFVLQIFVYRGAIIWFGFTGDNFFTVLTALIVCFAGVSALLIRKVYKIYYAGR